MMDSYHKLIPRKKYRTRGYRSFVGLFLFSIVFGLCDEQKGLIFYHPFRMRKKCTISLVISICYMESWSCLLDNHLIAMCWLHPSVPFSVLLVLCSLSWSTYNAFNTMSQIRRTCIYNPKPVLTNSPSRSFLQASHGTRNRCWTLASIWCPGVAMDGGRGRGQWLGW